MNEHLIDIFEEIEDFHWWFEGRRVLLSGVMKKYGKREMEILDVGCGTGGNMKFLKQFGEVWGVDSMLKAVKMCRRRGWKRVRLARAEKLPFEKEKFDAVMFLDVLEHIRDDVGALTEAGRVLKKGGIVVITAPSSPGIWSAHDEMQGHFRRYSRGGLKELGERAGLELAEMRQFNFFLWPVIAVVRKMSLYRPFRRLGEYDSRINFDIAKMAPVNRALLKIFKSEIVWGEKVQWPTGVSILAVWRKP